MQQEWGSRKYKKMARRRSRAGIKDEQLVMEYEKPERE